MKTYRDLTDTTRSLISLAGFACGCLPVFDYGKETIIKIEMHKPLYRWGEWIIIKITDHNNVEIEAEYEYPEDDRLEDVIYYFLGEHGICNVVSIEKVEQTF